MAIGMTAIAMFNENRIFYLHCSEARAMEYSLVLAVSPREVSTQGTLAPTTMHPSSAPANLVQVL